ncbi:uncharacterized protein LOC105637737 [Jatropha curcas]|uniref:uncharacterized protein LOC105637737 n=1 Tax=Jatropha curcas TaxID=180498 RepID=UPI0018952FA1|nr:uncharacterized protein LOC105637737 [Jatropha curcas]
MDLRPIALCQVLYKIISKMYANRLKAILPKIISPTQSACVLGRHIQDNSIIASESVHYLKARRCGRVGYAALKIDISKAYDRLEWIFLSVVMRKMGFSEKWIAQILHCSSSVSYKVLHQGQVIGPIVPSRGLRQGDPLSPYLFIICTEALSRLIQAKENAGAIHGIKIIRGAPTVSHLFFADDSVLFFKATIPEAQTIQSLLSEHALASGHAINFSKSLVYFSPNTDTGTKRDICSLLQVGEHDDLGTYLGLPMAIRRNKKEVFGYIKDRFWKKLNSWKIKKLSKAGIHWMSWECLCRDKNVGGLAFKQLREFNIALLGKIRWKLIKEPESLVAQLLKVRYYANVDFLAAPLGGAYSEWDVLESWMQKEYCYMDLLLNGRWNEQLIRRIFNYRDVSFILRIPIITGVADEIIWRFEIDGSYSVKTAYRALVQKQPLMIHADMRRLWTRLWKIRAPSQIWSVRNDIIWSQKHSSPMAVWHKASSFLSDWLKVAAGSSRTPSVVSKWQKSELNWVKLNVDAAVYTDGTSAGYRAVLWDSDAVLLGVKIGKFEVSLRPIEAEAMAIKEALSWLEDGHQRSVKLVKGERMASNCCGI